MTNKCEKYPNLCGKKISMKSTHFGLVGIISLTLNVALVTGIYYLSWQNNYSPTATETVKCIIFSIFLSVLLLILNKFKSMFKIADHSLFSTHIQPVLKELLKYGVLAFIALHQQDDGSWVRKLTIYQVLTILSVFLIVNLAEFVFDFMPVFYFKRFDLFLKLYDDFYYMENYDDESRTDATIKVVESLKRVLVADDSLAGILPKKISICDINFDDETVVGSSNESSPTSVKFNKSVFDPSVKPLTSSPHLKRNPPSPKNISKYKSCYDLVDKLYSISPKNTFHLVTASATAMTRDDVAAVRDEASVAGSIYEDVDSPFIDDVDNTSIHTTDTDLTGGGGGGFKYKMPGGGKILFGGGGGFSYKHLHHKKKSSASETLSRKSTFSFHSKSSKQLCEDTTRVRRWMNWLIPVRPKQKSVKKQLSMFNFRGPTETSSLLSDTQTYNSVDDLESQPVSPIEFTKEEFNNYLYISLGLDKFKIDYDPIFEKFGKKIIRDMPMIEVLLCFMNKLIWVIGSLLVYCTVFLDGSRNYLVLVLILKLFNVNWINRLNLKLRNMLIIKVLFNVLIFSLLVVF